MAQTAGVLPWKDIGPEGRTDGHGEEGYLPFTQESIRDELSSAWAWVMS